MQLIADQLRALTALQQANGPLDAVVTMVDAKQAAQRLDEHGEAQEQVGFYGQQLMRYKGAARSEGLVEAWFFRAYTCSWEATWVRHGSPAKGAIANSSSLDATSH